ncbi:MAG: ABC transporter ATP-binding protein [Rhodospirillales bacterium]|nr:ABC transporter ATP-binding protein [Rhodospirillales bacterium]
MLLSVRGLTAGYEETCVVRGVDLDLRESETFVLVGPNGHGKTTLLRAISGLLRPQAGEVWFDGRRIDQMRTEELAPLGLVHIPQGDHLFPDLTVEENLLMGAFPRASWRGRRQRLDRVYALFPRLADRRRQRARTLSGGERRQVALGRGLMQEARLLLVDEPSLGLAPVIVDVVYDALKQIAAELTGVLLVEENFAHIGEIADRVGVFEMGRIVREGSAAELAADRMVAESYLGGIA